MAVINYYTVLGIAQHSDLETIKKAFRKEIALHHPDNNSHPDAKEKFDALVEAFDVLSNSEKRKQYDELLEKSKSPQNVVILSKSEKKKYSDWQKEAKKKSNKSWETPLTELLLLDLFFDLSLFSVFDGLGESLGDALDDISDVFDIF